MKLTVVRAIPLTLALAAGMFVLSGVPRFKNAHHGIDAVVGDIVWLGFLVTALAAVVLVAVALYRRRIRALHVGGAALLALALAGAATAASSTVSVVLTKHGPVVTGPTSWHPGAARIQATSQQNDQEVTLLRFRHGYSYAQFVADGRTAHGHSAAARAAIARVFAHVIFAGGIDLFRGQSAVFGVGVSPGTYYLGEMTTRPQLTPIHVRGTRTNASQPSAATIDATRSGYRIDGRVPAHGTITVENTSRVPQRLNLIPVKAGTTRAQVLRYVRSTGGSENAPPPPFALNGPQLGTADLSPRHQMQLTYRLPAGTYVAIDFDQDLRTGRPEALEGMVAVITLR
jgi:hypothetical protein